MTTTAAFMLVVQIWVAGAQPPTLRQQSDFGPFDEATCQAFARMFVQMNNPASKLQVWGACFPKEKLP